MGRGRAKVTLSQMHDRGKDDLGRLYWRIRGPDPATGTRKTFQVGWWTPLEAEEERGKIEARLKLGLSPVDDSTRPWTVSELVSAYTEEMAERLGSDHRYVVCETRRLAYVSAHLGGVQADRVTRQRLEQYVAARRKDPNRTKQPVRRKSLLEEILSLLRAYKVLRELGKIRCDPPPMPLMKSVPDDARPQRRLTEAEVSKLIRAAELEDLAHAWEPREETTSRRIFDLIQERPGITYDDLEAELEVDRARLRDLARALRTQGRLRSLDDRWYLAERQPVYGLWSMVTVLAWTGRRPIAVFGVRRKHCDRLLDEGLPRRERLMFWEQDKGGVGRGWGPLPEPAFVALQHRAREVTDPEALLWKTSQGREWNAIRINRVFARVIARAELMDVQPYDLRRFAITRILREAGGQTAVARKYTGHRSDRALLRYVYAPEGEAEELAAEIGWSKPKLKEVPNESS